MNKRRNKRLTFLAGPLVGITTLLICFLLVETAARVFFSRPGMNFGIEMWKYAKHVKIRSKNPNMSHQHRPNAEAFLMGVDVKINSLGLRDDELSPEKPPGTYRILVLGDSTTFGWGASFQHLYTELIERSLNDNPPSTKYEHYEVVNTGVGNYNTVQEVAAFQEFGLTLAPDQVWITWFINDAEPTPRPSNNWFAKNSYGYNFASYGFDNLLRGFNARENYSDYYRNLYSPDHDGWQDLQKAFKQLSTLCKEKGIPLRLLLLPELHTVGRDYEFTDIHDLMTGLAEKNGVASLDLLDAFPSGKDPLNYWVDPADAHPNDLAMRLIGARIERAIRKEHWVPH